jgi:hypothetical protein
MLLIPGLIGCTVKVRIGSMERNFNIGSTPMPQATYTPNPTYTARPFYTPRPTYTPNPTYTPLGIQPVPVEIAAVPGEISQFATEAKASSQYSQPGWSAMQAIGAPNTVNCGDFSSAWASLSSSGKDWILLTYTQSVIPTRIIIYQTYHPGAVSRVEVVDEAGNLIMIYQAVPAITSQCPDFLEIEVTDVNTLVRSVRVTIDQSSHNGWSEIDAVQLLGKPK